MSDCNARCASYLKSNRSVGASPESLGSSTPVLLLSLACLLAVKSPEKAASLVKRLQIMIWRAKGLQTSLGTKTLSL